MDKVKVMEMLKKANEKMQKIKDSGSKNKLPVFIMADEIDVIIFDMQCAVSGITDAEREDILRLIFHDAVLGMALIMMKSIAEMRKGK
jgi:hypothetical protein